MPIDWSAKGGSFGDHVHFPAANTSSNIWAGISGSLRMYQVHDSDVFLGVSYIELNGGAAATPTAGEADIYAIIATPAA